MQFGPRKRMFARSIPAAKRRLGGNWVTAGEEGGVTAPAIKQPSRQQSYGILIDRR